MSVSTVHDCPLIGSAHAAPQVDDDPALVDHADGSTNFTEFIEVPYECVFDCRKAWHRRLPVLACIIPIAGDLPQI